MLLTFLGVFGVVAVVSLLLPSSYQSTATILIEQQEIPNDLVRTTISSYADQRLQTIQQRVMTRDNLLELVDRFDLYAAKRERMPVEQLLATVADNITMNVIEGEFIDPRRGIPTSATIAFELGFVDRSPEKAFKVANELYTLYSEENLRSRNELVTETSSFLTSEANKLNERVLELEAQLAEFKERHINELPELLDVNWQMLDRSDAELREIERSRRSLEDQVVYLESEMTVLNPYDAIISETGSRLLSPADRLAALQAELAVIQSRYSSDHPDMLRIQSEISSLESEVSSRDQNRALHRELEQARTRLAEIRERYSEDHPDVILLTSQINVLVRKLDQKVDASQVDVEPTNPAYIQLRSKLETARLEMKSLASREQDARRKIRDLEARISRTPGVERTFRELAREYTNASAKFQEVKAKQLEAELAESLERERKGEKFTLIDPPRVPETPVSPNRLLIAVAGLILALGGAFGIGFLSESLDPRVYGAASIEAALGVGPTVSIPVIRNTVDRKQRATRSVLLGTTTVVALCLAVIAFHLWVMPVGTATAILLNRIGGS